MFAFNGDSTSAVRRPVIEVNFGAGGASGGLSAAVGLGQGADDPWARSVRDSTLRPERVESVLDANAAYEVPDQRKQKPESPCSRNRWLLTGVLILLRHLVCHEEHDDGVQHEIDDHVHDATESVVTVWLEVLTC